MSFLSRLESAFGLTRGDVTIALFVALTALFGFVYLTFFDDRTPEHERLELLRLQARYDSLVAERERSPMAQFQRDVAADSAPALASVLAEEPAPSKSAKASRSGAQTLPSTPVNLNSAPKEELVRLPGVGEKTAEAIIDRRRHVPFRRVEDLMEVKGIGEKKLARMRPHIVVR